MKQRKRPGILAAIVLTAAILTLPGPVLAQELPAESAALQEDGSEPAGEPAPETQTDPSPDDVPTQITQTPAEEELPAPSTPASQPSEPSPGSEPTQSPQPSVPPATEEAALSPAPINLTPEQVTVEQALSMTGGDGAVVVQGTVVFAGGSQIVLQDDTGGMRISFPTIVPFALGDIIRVLGYPSGSFSPESWETVGIGALPAISASLPDAPENTRMVLRSVTLADGILTQGECRVPYVYSAPLPIAEGGTADVYGVLMNQYFYADTILPLESSTPGEAGPGSVSSGGQIYFGLLHAHTNLSDGTGSVSEAFTHAAQVPGLDFFAVTDHSSAFDNAGAGSILTDGAGLSAAWSEGKAAAAAVTSSRFVGLFGYEMTWPISSALGHMNTFLTPGWEAVTQEPFPSLAEYWDALTQAPGSISQFNHPGSDYGSFADFSQYSPQWDRAIQLLEVGWGEGITALDAYTQALDQGWHLAPSVSQNNHDGSWGDASDVRTAVLAQELTEAGLCQAIQSYRVYATEDKDLSVHYRVNGQDMGSILTAGDSLTLEVQLEDPTDGPSARIQVIADGGVVAAEFTSGADGQPITQSLPGGYSYYYLYILQEDGDQAVTAPVWVEDYTQLGVESLCAEEETLLSGEETSVCLTLFNREWEPLVLDSLTVYANGVPVYQAPSPGSVWGSASFPIPIVWTEPGPVEIRAVASGTVAGLPRTLEASLDLTCQGPQQTLTLYSIGEARLADQGACLQVRGYVTAGTDNPSTTFPDTLYLQDDTGAIAVTGVLPQGIQIGCPMEIIGILTREGGNPVLELTDYTFLTDPFYRYAPRTMSIKTAMNYDVHGDEVIQLEGTVLSAEQTADGEGISRFVMQDIRGDQGVVVIEPWIRSGSSGVNDLTKQVQVGQVVRVIGLCHRTAQGETVLQVRNCDEVVLVPPEPDPTNPKTGDSLLLHLLF